MDTVKPGYKKEHPTWIRVIGAVLLLTIIARRIWPMPDLGPVYFFVQGIFGGMIIAYFIMEKRKVELIVVVLLAVASIIAWMVQNPR